MKTRTWLEWGIGFGVSITIIGIIIWPLIKFYTKPIPIPEPTKVTEAIYIVKEGDTLGEIAKKFYGKESKYKEVAIFNNIPNPNLLLIGQKIRLPMKGAYPPPVKKELTREEKVDKLAKFMFKTSGLKCEEKSIIEMRMRQHQEHLTSSHYKWMDNQRTIITRLYEMTRQHEIWTLAEAIVDVGKTGENVYLLTALAWHESHFVNRVGSRGEVSFYQFLPSTIKERTKCDDIVLQATLWTLKNDLKIATSLALTMINEHKTIREGLMSYNHNPDYPYILSHKMSHIKEVIK